MIRQLRESIKVVVKDEMVGEGLISTNIPERHSRWVHRNQKIIWREL